MNTSTHCARCHRVAPREDSDEFIDWEALGAEGVLIVCPDCITDEEHQAMIDDWANTLNESR